MRSSSPQFKLALTAIMVPHEMDQMLRFLVLPPDGKVRLYSWLKTKTKITLRELIINMFH